MENELAENKSMGNKFLEDLNKLLSPNARMTDEEFQNNIRLNEINKLEKQQAKDDQKLNDDLAAEQKSLQVLQNLQVIVSLQQEFRKFLQDGKRFKKIDFNKNPNEIASQLCNMLHINNLMSTNIKNKEKHEALIYIINVIKNINNTNKFEIPIDNEKNEKNEKIKNERQRLLNIINNNNEEIKQLFNDAKDKRKDKDNDYKRHKEIIKKRMMMSLSSENIDKEKDYIKAYKNYCSAEGYYKNNIKNFKVENKSRIIQIINDLLTNDEDIKRLKEKIFNKKDINEKTKENDEELANEREQVKIILKNNIKEKTLKDDCIAVKDKYITFSKQQKNIFLSSILEIMNTKIRNTYDGMIEVLKEKKPNMNDKEILQLIKDGYYNYFNKILVELNATENIENIGWGLSSNNIPKLVMKMKMTAKINVIKYRLIYSSFGGKNEI